MPCPDPAPAYYHVLNPVLRRDDIPAGEYSPLHVQMIVELGHTNQGSVIPERPRTWSGNLIYLFDAVRRLLSARGGEGVSMRTREGGGGGG